MEARELEGRSLPHSLDAERSVLGGVLLDDEVLHEVEALVSPEDFFRRAHRVVFQAMTRLKAAGEAIDLVTLTEALKNADELDASGGVDYLASLDTQVPTASHAVSYAKIVRDQAVLRRLMQTLEGVLSEARSGPGEIRDFVDRVEGEIFKVTQANDPGELVRAGDVALDVFNLIEERLASGTEITGVPTGFVDLDKQLSGLQRGDLVILAARPSMGKTAFVLNICANAAIRNEPQSSVAVFSLEMPREQLVMRMLASEGRIPLQQLRTGRIPKTHWTRLVSAAQRLDDTKLFIDDTSALSLSAVRSKCRRMKASHGLDLVVIDYLQLMHGPKTDNREQEIAAISRGLKTMAKDLDVPVVALSQLNRSLERRENKRPQLSDLRESGAIEQDADVIGFIHREDRYRQKDEPVSDEGVAEIIIAKQRNGPIGTVEVIFFQEYTRFDNLERRDV